MNTNWKTQFIRIYTGQAFSLIGSAAVQFAIIWWLTILTESALTLTIASIVAFLPNLILGPFAGVWIDRYNRKTVIMMADGFIALTSVLLAFVFVWSEVAPLWLIYLILFLRGIGNTFHSPAMQAAIPMLVPAEMLTKAGGWGNLISSVANMLGPVLGAALMAWLPVASIMLVDIVGAVIAISCLLTVSIPDIEQKTEKVTFLADILQGYQAARRNKPLLAILPGMLLCNIIYIPLGTLFPLLIRLHFQGTAWHNSIAEFVFAGGLLLSSISIGIFGGMKKRFLMVSLAIALLGITAFVSGILPQQDFGYFVICCFFMGAAGTYINVPLMAYTQETIEPEMMGKVFSLLMMLMSLAMPIGLLIAGPISDAIGVDSLFMYCGILLLLTAVISRIQTRKYDELTMAPIKETE